MSFEWEKKKTLKSPFQREQTLDNGIFTFLKGEMAERGKPYIHLPYIHKTSS